MTRTRLVGLLTLVFVGCAGSAPVTDAAQPKQDRGQAPELAPNEAMMSKGELGKDWPLTVEEGIVRCEGASEVYFTAEGRTYAVNGMAMTVSDLPEIDAIWADNPDIKGLKINIGPIIDRGLELCN